MRRPDLQWMRRAPWIAWTLTLLGALLLKLDYHRATVNTLRWILGPTARLVASLRDQPLVLDPSLGYVASDGSFVIAPACAGVNFLILAFVVAVLGFVHRLQRPQARAAWLLGAALGAWALTIAVNALRIVLAVELYSADVQFGWLTPERLHRAAGTAVYVLALWLEWHALDWLSSRLAARTGDLARRHALWIVPAAYLGMTLIVPLLNGAWRAPLYAEHALSVTLVASLVLLALVCVSQFWARICDWRLALSRRWPRRRVFACGARVNTSL